MVFEKNFLILTVTVGLQKNEYSKNVNFLILYLSQQVIRTSLKQNKFTFHPHFQNHGFAPLIMLQVYYEAHSTNRRDIGQRFGKKT